MSIEEIPFRISTGLKDIIGKELITDDHIAIFELVKNSYDAYAKNVKIIFKNVTGSISSKDSKIIIIDDGHGMSKDDIEKKWLFVGFSEKKITKNQQYLGGDKIKNKRIFAGSKGIGRFSSDRLGRYLTLYTKQVNEKAINKLELDWKLFEDEKVQGDDFQTIKAEYSTVNHISSEYVKGNFNKGTVLEISRIHEKWDENKLIKLKRYLQRLINPAQNQKSVDFSIEIIADEFKDNDKKNPVHKKINGPVQNFVFEKLGIKTTQIISEIKDELITTQIFDKGNLVVKFEEDNKYKLLDNISVNLFYLNTDAKAIFTKTMGVQPKNYGSIFLYRNGFRVYSYGDEGNDWLGLETRKGQGYARFLAARETMGRIEINGIQPEFKELSSRSEGLVKNDTYRQLIDYFMESAFKRFERYVVQGIQWDAEGLDPEDIKKTSTEIILKIIGQKTMKNIQFGKDLLKVLNDKRTRQIPEIIKNFEAFKKNITSPADRKYLNEEIKTMKHATKTLEYERDNYKKKYEIKYKEALFLNNTISSDKDKVANLVHNMKTSSEAINDKIYKINKALKRKAGINEIIPLFDEISIENKKIERIAKIITTATFDLFGDTITDDLVKYITQYLQIGSDKKSYDIGIRVIHDDIEFETEFYPIEISLILDNFMVNSSTANATMLTLMFEKMDRKLRILVGDDGNGISKENQEFIFARGFTTTKSGTGLGLFYNHKMIHDRGGTLKFLGNDVIPELGKGACFEMVLH